MKTVAVIFGGRSTEHDISIITALSSIIRPLELSKKYRVLPVYISRQGSWYCDQKFKHISFFQSKQLERNISQMKSIGVKPANGLKLVLPGRVRQQEVTVDVVFPALHGTYGEDGSLMGLLNMANVPYVGCNLAASVIAMDKVLAKQVTTAEHIPSTPWIWCTAADTTEKTEAVVKHAMKKLQWPIFVKPAHLGSSIGITRAINELELRNALEVAAHYDDKIIIEQGVQNLIEVTLPIMGNEVFRPAFLEQPLASAEDFFNFDTKYMNGGEKGGKTVGKSGSKSVGVQGYSKLPADIPEDVYERAEKVGLDVYQAIGCSGIARVDMLIDSKSKEVFFNEVNPMPGSLYAHNWRQAGVSGVELVEKLIGLAEERYAQEKDLTRTFSSSFLQQF